MNMDTKIVKAVCTVVAIIAFISIYAPFVLEVLSIMPRISTIISLLWIFISGGLSLLMSYITWRMENIEEEREENRVGTGE